MPDASPEQSPSIGQLYLNSVQNGGEPSAVPESAPTAPPASPPSVGLQNVQPVVAPSPGVTPALTQPQPDPVTAKHTAIGRVFSTLMSGGTGSSASNFWRSLIGGAIAGMGAAADAPIVSHGPYGDVRATGAGNAAVRAIGGVQKYNEQQQDRQRQQAKEDADEARKNQESQIQMDDLTLRKAADARAQVESIQRSAQHEVLMKRLGLDVQNGQFDLAKRAADEAQQQVTFQNALSEVGATPLPDAEGEPLKFKTLQEAEQAAHNNPKYFIGNFKTRVAYDPGSNAYSIYRVPDVDVKNVKLTDAQGVEHNIPRMSPSDYLDFQSRQQNLKKGDLAIQEAQERLKELRDDRKSSTAYGAALAELDKVNGDADKLSPSSRTLLYSTASKNLGDAIRAKAAADKAEDASAQEAADEAVKHYSGVLSQLHGRLPAPQASALAPAAYDKALQHALTLPADQAIAEINSAKVLSDADKQKLVKDIDQKRLESVAPYMTALRGPGGKTINVMSTDVPNWTKQGYTVIGQGAAPQAKVSTEIEREK
jgi:hypothetical protein